MTAPLKQTESIKDEVLSIFTLHGLHPPQDPPRKRSAEATVPDDRTEDKILSISTFHGLHPPRATYPVIGQRAEDYQEEIFEILTLYGLNLLP